MTQLTTQEQQIIKNHFQKQINRRSRKAIIAFLVNHFRYDTMSSWNRSTSYSHNIKLTHLRSILPNDIDETAWAMLNCLEWHNHMNDLMRAFDKSYNNVWQIGVNGRSDGYIVLYQGGIRDGKQFCYPGKSLDQNEDFHKWDMNDLRSRLDIVHDFDMLAADIVMDFGAFCRSYDVVDKIVLVPKTIPILQRKS